MAQPPAQEFSRPRRNRLNNRLRRASVFVAATLAGGTLFGTCQTRIHDSVINGTQLFILNLLNPSNVVIGDG